MIKFRFLLIFCLAFLMSGCAAHHMALTQGQSDIDLTKKSIALLSVKTSNQLAPTFQFNLFSAIICPQSETCSNPRPYLHKANSPYKSEKDRFNEYLLSFELEPGIYSIHSVGTIYDSVLSEAGGYVPLNLKMDIRSNTISYLGHIDIILRERKTDTEKRAGREIMNIIPLRIELKDTSRTGFSTGTFDVIVEDKFDEDMKSFISEYPVLQKIKVERNILPQWIRPEQRTTN
ncbi:MAG: hypothetical protein ABFD82_21425 [Syntrophaceae bacterium]